MLTERNLNTYISYKKKVLSMPYNYPNNYYLIRHFIKFTLLLSLFSFSNYAISEDKAYQLYKAAENGDIETVEQLISEGVSVNAKNKSGSYALNAAAYKNDHKLIELLLKHGADVDSRNRGLDTPLICTTKYSNGNENTIMMLLEAGSDVNAVDEDGNTALHYAKKKNQKAAVEILEASN